MRGIVTVPFAAGLLAAPSAVPQERPAQPTQLLSAMDPSSHYTSPRFGFINREGEWVIRPTFRTTQDFSEGLARARKHLGKDPNDKELWGYIDTTGAWVIEPRFRFVLPFSNGLAHAMVSDDSSGFIDRTGRFLEIAPFELSEKDKTRTVRGELLWERDRSNLVPAEKLIPVKFGKLAGYVDVTGKVAIRPQFENARPFSEGLAAVKVVGKWGFIDTTGTVVIAPQFGEVERFSGGFAQVRVRGGMRTELWNFADRTGKLLCPAPFRVTGYFSEGLAVVVAEKGPDKAGYIDATCQTVIEPQYDQARSFSEGLALVRVGRGVWYYIDGGGNRVIEVPLEGGVATVPGSFDGGVAPVALYEEFLNCSPTEALLTCTSRGPNRFLKGTYYLDREGKRIAPK